MRSAGIRHFLFLAFVASMAVGLFIYVGVGKEFEVREIRDYAHSLGPLLPVVFIFSYIVISIFFPTTPMMALSGILFGFWQGLIYTATGGIISSFITFYIARFLGKDFVDKILHKKFLEKLEEYDQKVGRRGFLTIVVLRILPIMPFNVLNLIMGVSKIKTKDYILGTLVGLAPSHLLAI